jgi:pimeloyl-ACP methyl ester carboxylesterase
MTMNRRAALRIGAAGGAALIGAAANTPALATGQPTTPRQKDEPWSDDALVRLLPGDFRNGYAAVNGTTLHYVTGGQGAPLVLLPGWPQTWWQFRKIMPELARHFRVIAVDLRGMNSSGKPADGYDKKTMAEDIYQLVHQLGYDRVDIAGHDIGSMVAFSLAANHPEAIRRLSMLDVAHPDPSLYQLTLLPRPGVTPFFLWWFAFNQVRVLPEQLLTDRFRYLTDYLCEVILLDQAAIDDHARAVYANAYASPDAIRAGNGWYQTFGQDIIDGQTYPELTLPVQAMYAQGNTSLVQSLAGRAGNVQPVQINDSGHYLAEEQPDAVTAALTPFFTD